MQEITEKILSIRSAITQDIPDFYSVVEQMGQGKAVGYFERLLERQANQDLLLLRGDFDNRIIGYGIYNRVPKYGFYKALGIPEIQDLNVIGSDRRKGYATAMIGFCEDLVRREGHEHIGISVGLHRSYGPAQRLYYKLGYIPDGHGVTYDRKSVGFGELKPVDDDLCLMMVKDL